MFLPFEYVSLLFGVFTMVAAATNTPEKKDRSRLVVFLRELIRLRSQSNESVGV
jgi:hypothetical protein